MQQHDQDSIVSWCCEDMLCKLGWNGGVGSSFSEAGQRPVQEAAAAEAAEAAAEAAREAAAAAAAVIAAEAARRRQARFSSAQAPKYAARERGCFTAESTSLQPIQYLQDLGGLLHCRSRSL